MARTPLAQALSRIASSVAGSMQGEPGTPAAGPARRTVLKGAGALAAGLAVPGVTAGPARAAGSGSGGSPRIVIVGAGLAGLSAAYQLRNAGYSSTVVEASNRVGGRCWTINGYFDERQVAEHGGELIDQNHNTIRQLAQSLGLQLDNLLSAEQNGTEPIYYFDGAPYTYDEATRDIKAIWQQLHSDVSAAGYPTTYLVSTPRGRELDAMSITTWISTYVPGGLGSRLGQLLDVAYNIEYGGECSVQSSLNMLYLLAYSGQGQLRIFGASNEKYHVRGGNQQIPDRMADVLGGSIELGTELVALARRSDGTWTVTTRKGTSASVSRVADHVVLALPFSTLRSVDLREAGFPALKRTAINQLSMGTNSKLQLQFRDRHWRSLGGNGDTFSDQGYQSTWEVTRAQPGKQGILVDYTGGAIGASFTGSPDYHARTFLTQIEPVFPGISERWNGKVTLDFWKIYRWTLGSYSYWKVGQYTRFSGVEGEAVGTCHFAGEHTSQDFQGYLNGAVESGYRAADEILAALK